MNLILHHILYNEILPLYLCYAYLSHWIHPICWRYDISRMARFYYESL